MGGDAQPTLYLTRGLSGSGKTTVALRMLEERNDLIRFNRDLFRLMMFGPKYKKPRAAPEDIITAIRDEALRFVLRRGYDVVIDDTNLNPQVVTHLVCIAQECGVKVEIIDLLDVPLEECIRRDSLRSGIEHVGESVIRRQHQRYILPLKEAKK